MKTNLATELEKYGIKTEEITKLLNLALASGDIKLSESLLTLRANMFEEENLEEAEMLSSILGVKFKNV
tara:strand:+ start:2742 stop:2948 length:207 start_codon:yes stop_codon:yes gene_type:complete